MLDKMLKFLEYYIENTNDVIKKYGKYKTLSAGLNELIRRQSFAKDELRKELSLYIKRIIHPTEFEELLDYDRIEYARILLCEV